MSIPLCLSLLDHNDDKYSRFSGWSWDRYVKIYLLPDRSKTGKRKTRVKKHTLNPIFDEILKFPLTIGEVEGRNLWMTVWHSDMFGRNDFLGEITLPLGHDVFENPGLKWYPLQEKVRMLKNIECFQNSKNEMEPILLFTKDVS